MRETSVWYKYWWLTSAFYKKDFFIYAPAYGQTTMYGENSLKAGENGVKAKVRLSFNMNSLRREYNIVRVNIFFLLGSFGSITYLCKNLGNAVTKIGSKFGLDNSMIKRLYSMERKVDGHYVDIEEKDNR